MFQLSGDLGFVKETAFQDGIVDVLGKDLLQGNFTLDRFIPREGHDTQTAPGMLPQDGERLLLGG